MNSLRFDDHTVGKRALGMQRAAWAIIFHNFENLLSQWVESAPTLAGTFTVDAAGDTPVGYGSAFGKDYKVVISCTLLDNAAHGKVSIIITNPVLGEPYLASTFLITQEGYFLNIDGVDLCPDDTTYAPYRIILESIYTIASA